MFWFIARLGEVIEILAFGAMAVFLVSYYGTQQFQTIAGYCGVEKYKHMATPRLLWANARNLVISLFFMWAAWVVGSLVWAILEFMLPK